MTRKLFLATFFLIFFHPVQAQLEYALAPEKKGNPRTGFRAPLRTRL